MDKITLIITAGVVLTSVILLLGLVVLEYKRDADRRAYRIAERAQRLMRGGDKI